MNPLFGYNNERGVDNMEITKIYFDMDGVLADFDRGVSELCGMEPLRQSTESGASRDDEMWEKVKNIEHFYDKLELCSGAKEMFDEVYERYGDKCEVLSAIPKPKRGIIDAGEDKINWVHRLLSRDIKVNIVVREQKPDYCTGKDSLLIDDLEKNIAEWNKLGGTGILHKNTDATLARLKEMGIL